METIASLAFVLFIAGTSGFVVSIAGWLHKTGESTALVALTYQLIATICAFEQGMVLYESCGLLGAVLITILFIFIGSIAGVHFLQQSGLLKT